MWSVLMSRAFVSESDDVYRDDDIPQIKVPLADGVKNYMTPGGAERIKEELCDLIEKRERLSTEISKEVVGEDSQDREKVISERRHLREIDRRLDYLSTMMDKLEIVDPRNTVSDRVLFGATVTVLEDLKHERVYKIVGVDESDPSEGLISWISPLAKAILLTRVGESVNLTLPKGKTVLKILKIAYI
jgi:transcription elongation factor GreB